MEGGRKEGRNEGERRKERKKEKEGRNEVMEGKEGGKVGRNMCVKWSTRRLACWACFSSLRWQLPTALHTSTGWHANP